MKTTFGQLKQFMAGTKAPKKYEQKEEEKPLRSSPWSNFEQKFMHESEVLADQLIRDANPNMLGDTLISIGCGNTHHDRDHTSQDDMEKDLRIISNEETDEGTLTMALQRRRLMMHSDPSTCSNVSNFYCWMSCRDVPDASEAQTKQD